MNPEFSAAGAPAGPQCAADLLVIGYGNTLRQDDSVGPRVADAVEVLRLPGVSTLSLPQLSPEHAEILSQVRNAVFVDAAVDAPGNVRLRPIEPAASSQVTTHACEPPTLLALARDVFGRAPGAWLLTIPAVRLGFGEDLSPEAETGVEAAVREITGFARSRQLSRPR